MRLVAKHSEVGYQTPGERPGCRNCTHFMQPSLAYVAPRSYCDKHGLEITSGGICNSHKLQRKPGEAQLVFLARQRDLLVSLSDDAVTATAEAKRRFAPQAGEMRA